MSIRANGLAVRRTPMIYAQAYGTSVGESVFVKRASSTASHHDSGPRFRLHSGAASIPHPEKADKGGEDAIFVSVDNCAVGVFDGVGGWAEVGVDPGIYSKNLAMECGVAYEKLGAESPCQLMDHAWSKSHHITGSSTACCVTLSGNILRAANLGDSGFLIVRNGSLLYRQKEQQHSFNCPYQLGTNSQDKPSDSDLYELEVEHGDVIVVGTDGVFDNVFTDDLVAIVVEGIKLGKNHNDISNRIAHVASLKANSASEKTPFSDAAASAGYYFQGGKLDDISVVVSIVHHDPGPAKL